jgi:hypothetical protein
MLGRQVGGPGAMATDDAGGGMNSSIIGKIDKARRYALEPERVQLGALAATFRGSNDEYELTLDSGAWRCSCHFFETHGTCAHIIAAQRILAPMLPEDARYERTALSSGFDSSLIGKLDKARHYAQEPDRLAIRSLATTFRGSNGDHDLGLQDGGWNCACHYFEVNGTCAHSMAAQRILAPMLPEDARYERTALSSASHAAEPAPALV